MKWVLGVILLLCVGCGEQHYDPCHEQPTPNDDRPDILVIGDSISIGYTPYIQRQLPRFDISHNTCNAMDTANGVRNIAKWVTQRNHWESITFNFGLWDAADWVETSNYDYRSNLIKIALMIKLYTDQPMYILTTEVLPGTPNRLNSRVIELNQIATEVMTELGIPVLDLYTYSQKLSALHVDPYDVHFNERGSKLLAKRIVKELDLVYGR